MAATIQNIKREFQACSQYWASLHICVLAHICSIPMNACWSIPLLFSSGCLPFWYHLLFLPSFCWGMMSPKGGYLKRKDIATISFQVRGWDGGRSRKRSIFSLFKQFAMQGFVHQAREVLRRRQWPIWLAGREEKDEILVFNPANALLGF